MLIYFFATINEMQIYATNLNKTSIYAKFVVSIPHILHRVYKIAHTHDNDDDDAMAF